MPPRPELHAFASRTIDLVAENVLANEQLLAAESLKPPNEPRARAEWARRVRDRRAAIRLGTAMLAQLIVIEQGSQETEHER